MDKHLKDYTAHVHDNTIQSYSVDFNNGLLRLNTSYENKENTVVEFSGLLAHRFDNVIPTNIIFGIYEVSVHSFIEDELENLTDSLRYGFPSWTASSVEELRVELEEYNIFYLDSSFGLSGYVIAKNIKVTTTEIT